MMLMMTYSSSDLFVFFPTLCLETPFWLSNNPWCATTYTGHTEEVDFNDNVYCLYYQFGRLLMLTSFCQLGNVHLQLIKRWHCWSLRRRCYDIGRGNTESFTSPICCWESREIKYSSSGLACCIFRGKPCAEGWTEMILIWLWGDRWWFFFYGFELFT